jgi:hypothetical protein
MSRNCWLEATVKLLVVGDQKARQLPYAELLASLITK